MKITLTIIIFSAFIMIMCGCTAGPNELAGSADSSGHVAGFLTGLWHGFISLFTFFFSLFSDKISMYDVHNNGNWYNFGFLIGVTSFFGGSGGGAGRRSRRS